MTILEQINGASSLDIAKSYLGRGWSVIPVPLGKKGPNIKEWEKLNITLESAPDYFDGAPQNYGVLLGSPSGGLTDVDLDCDEARIIAPYIMPATGAIFGRKSSRNSHRLYVTDLAGSDDAKSAINFDAPDGTRLLEVRIGGSLHKQFSPVQHTRQVNVSLGRKTASRRV
jgi:hypothetical protein